MFNLLRMDLYRIKRSASVYVCAGILLLMTFAVFFMFWLMETPQGQGIAVRIGMLTAEAVDKSTGRLDGVDTLFLFRQMGLNGGSYNLIFGVWLVLFVCMDYQSGFIKNILALQEERWKYVAGKILAAGIVDAVFLMVQFFFVLLLNAFFGNMVSYAGLLDMVYYISWVWLLTAAFAVLMLLICIWSRSVAAGVLAAVLFGTGSVVAPLSSLLEMLHIGGWLRHSIYMTLSTGPDHYTGVSDLYVYAIGAVFLIIYAVAAQAVLTRQDV